MEVCALALGIFILLWLWLMCRSKHHGTVEGMADIFDKAADKASRRAQGANLDREEILNHFLGALEDAGVKVKKEIKHLDQHAHAHEHSTVEHFRWFNRPWRARNWWRYPYFYNSPYVYYPYWY